MRLRLTVAYVGTHYCGWQIQEGKKNLPTVQAALEAAFARVLCAPVRVHGAGRTDAGVHADAQVAHVDIPENRAHLDWRAICNKSLPSDICLTDVRPVPSDFHARFDARGKIYTYHFWQEAAFMPPRIAPFAWNCGFYLDWDAIARALPCFCGRHDFASLQNRGTDIQSTERVVRRVEIRPDLALLPHRASAAIQVEGEGFLKQMVRNMAGILFAVGRGRISADDIPALLELRDRSRLASCVTAPACGLTLTRVLYEEDLQNIENS